VGDDSAIGGQAEFTLSKAGSPGSLRSPGGFSGVVFHVDDVRKTVDDFKKRGIDITDGPRDEPWGCWGCSRIPRATLTECVRRPRAALDRQSSRAAPPVPLRSDPFPSEGSLGVMDKSGKEISSKQIWAGRVVGAVPVLFLLMDGGMKLFKPSFVVNATMELGYPESTIIGIGVVLLVSVVLHLVPRTSFLGALLITAYLGGRSLARCG